MTPILTLHRVMFSVVSAPPSPRSELLLLAWQLEFTTVLSPCPCPSKCGKQKLDTEQEPELRTRAVNEMNVEGVKNSKAGGE